MNQLKKLGIFEFVAMMALLMSLAALAIDAILPSLQVIRLHFQIENPNKAQHLISTVFAGLILGQLIYGPLSDSLGRKKLIYVGIIIFITGCVLSLVAQTYNIMLIGRFLQGIGAASTRVLTMAMVRDQYSGNTMAKIMSLITMVFIVVPALAPSLGMLIISIGTWLDIIRFFIFIAVVGILWLGLRQPETLAEADKKPLTLSRIFDSLKIVLSSRTTLGYATTSGVVFGAFIGYLLSSQQIFSEIFNREEDFPIYFGLLAISIGFSSYINSKVVEKYGMRKMCFLALRVISIISLFFLITVHYFNGAPSLVVFMSFMIPIFMCIGILFGNLTALAIEPVGHVAGVATAVITSLQNIVSLAFGAYTGSLFNNTIYPMAIGFFCLTLLSLVTMLWTENFKLQAFKASPS